MSNITIQPNGSGSGTFSIASPNSNTSRTLTLPDSDGTLLTSVVQSNIAAEAVNESKLQVSNAPTNGYFLSAQSGNTGGLTWAEASTPTRTWATQTRSLNTTYTNSTGNEIQVFVVWWNNATNRVCSWNIDGLQTYGFSTYVGEAFSTITVPDSATYRFNSTSTALRSWMELR